MRVCIVQPTPSTVSETFLDGQSRGITHTVDMVYRCADRKAIVRNGVPVNSSAASARGLRTLKRVFLHSSGSGRTPEYVAALKPSDVVLAQYGPTGTQVMDACNRLGKPLVVHFHGYDASQRATLEKYRDAYQRMFALAKAVVAVSNHMASNLQRLGCPTEKLVTNVYGTDCSHRVIDAAANGPTLISLGRFVEKKAPHLTLLAFAKVIEVMPEARLCMIGDGPLLGMCKDIAHNLGLSPHVEFKGSLNHDQAIQEMRTKRAFVQHSIQAESGDCEGTPLAILEAGALGLPVVSTRHAGIPDVVVDGSTGLLVEEKDVQGFKEAMLRVLQDARLAGRLGENASRRIRTGYDRRTSIGRLQKLLETVAAGHPPAKFV